MPTDAEIEFGRRAVAAGALNQAQLDEAIMILHDLERAGSRRRLWDVVTSKGFITAERADALRRAAGVKSPAPGHGGAHAPEAHTTPPEPTAEGFRLVRIRPGAEPKAYHLLMRPMTIGSDPHADIVLDEDGVEKRHARLTWADRGPTIWDVGTERGVLVNQRRITSALLGHGDLIRLGEAMFLAVRPGAGGLAVEPTTTALAGGEPAACLRVTEGSRVGEAFYLGARPLLIGHSPLCNVRLTDSDVAEFHAQLALGPTGARIQDLYSLSGIEINGQHLVSGEVPDGAQIGIGRAKFCFEKLREAPHGMPTASAPAATDAEGAASSDSVFEMPPDITLVDDEADELAGAGDQRTSAMAPAPPAEYKLGQLHLSGLEGAAEGRSFVLNKARMVIGREKGIEINIYDLTISRRHAMITIAGGKVEIEDLGSRNGIIINGHRVPQAHLKVGDTVRIGTSLLLVDWLRGPK